MENTFIRFLNNILNKKYQKRLLKNKYEYQCDYLGTYISIDLYYIAWSKLFNLEGYLLIKDGKYSWLDNYDPNFILSDNNILDIRFNKLTQREEELLSKIYERFEKINFKDNIENIVIAYEFIKEKFKDKR
jgi:hypothetical protein